MDFKDFEVKLNSLNQKINLFFQKMKEEEDNRIKVFFETIKNNIDNKYPVLESLENQIHNDNVHYEDELNKIALEIKAVSFIVRDPLINISEKNNELELKKQEEIKTYQTVQKRKKTEIVHKINNLNKELASILKENVHILNEEEKNYRSREFEINRRLNFDLQKSSEANIKEYIDIEKSLLDINDIKAINEVKKKINNIRIIGFNEQASIRNKHEFSNFENALEFKKFYEKSILDSSLVSEEYLIKVKALEVQKNEIEHNEKLRLTILDLEKQKQMLGYEKENRLYEIENQKVSSNYIFTLQSKTIAIKNEQAIKNNNDKNTLIHEVNLLDSTQFATFIPINQSSTDHLNLTVEFLFENMVIALEYFKETLTSTIKNLWLYKKQNRESLMFFLSQSLKELLVSIDRSYFETLISIYNETNDYVKHQNHRFLALEKSLQTIFKVIFTQIDEMTRTLKEYCKEEQREEKVFDKKINDLINQGYNNSNINQKEAHDLNLKKIIELKETFKKEKTDKDQEFDLLSANVLNEYNEKIKEIDTRIEQLKKETADKINNDNDGYHEYVKLSKSRITNLKYSYTDNLAKHEKDLEKKYKINLGKIEKDRKNKIKAL